MAARQPDSMATLVKRYEIAIAMQNEGIAMMRETLRRRHPAASEKEIKVLLMQWLGDRPLDAPGRVVPWPRERKRKKPRKTTSSDDHSA